MATACDARRSVAVALALALSWSAPAEAAPAGSVVGEDPEGAVRVVPVRVEGELPAHVRDDVDRRLRDSVADGAEVLDGADPRGCGDVECWRTLAGAAGARRLVQATIVVQDRDYDIRAEVVDGASGSVIASVTRRCEICGYEELGDTIELLGNALRRKLRSSVAALPVLVVKSTPAGAWVSVDGESVGTTPLELPMTEGPHDVRVSKSGHVAQLRRVALVTGVHERIELELEPLPRRDRGEGKSRVLPAVGGTAVGVGAAAIGAGVGLLLMDEKPQRSRCSGENVDIEGNCKYRYDTLGGGIAAVAVGAAVLATGVALLVVARKRGRSNRVAWDGVRLRF